MTLRQNEGLMINGQIHVVLLRTIGTESRLGINAPLDMKIAKTRIAPRPARFNK